MHGTCTRLDPDKSRWEKPLPRLKPEEVGQLAPFVVGFKLAAVDRDSGNTRGSFRQRRQAFHVSTVVDDAAHLLQNIKNGWPQG